MSILEIYKKYLFKSLTRLEKIKTNKVWVINKGVKNGDRKITRKFYG